MFNIMPKKDLTLEELPVGVAASIVTVGGEPSVVLRLMEMGLLKGTKVQVTRVAPMGDPLELRLRGYRLSIRKAQAKQIQVMLLSQKKTAENSATTSLATESPA